jgi:predicted O-linked N-acetylglucosamine transferase (SPINDLY family)
VLRTNSSPVPYKFRYPEIKECPIIKNTYLTIGCFNRVNKITEPVIKLFNNILLKNKNVRFVFKTKSLININIADKFISTFDKIVRNRIIILPCTLSHEEHLETYNLVDIAIDTFPYSGTTTSCESLFMGVPVLSLYDKKNYFHPQNVSVSILKNSGLDFYVCNNIEEFIDKIKIIEVKPIEFWKNLKHTTRQIFLNGKVCNKKLYIKNIQNLFVELFNKHKVL